MKRQKPPNATRDKIAEAIDQYIVLSTNAERDRRIMYRRLVDGITHERLAEEFDMSDTQIKTIVYKWIDIVFEHIE